MSRRNADSTDRANRFPDEGRTCMKEERTITVEGNAYSVMISDSQETLLAARAAGRVPVGLLGESSRDLSAARYLIETPEAADDRFLERVVRRELGLPWNIGSSDRLLIREFTLSDLEKVPQEPEDQEADRVFRDRDLLESYIRGQYGFYEYGVWAVVRKTDGRIIGKAGIVGCEEQPEGESGMPDRTEMQMELGYHIFQPYRKRGYAEEACRIILDYIQKKYNCPVCAVTLCSNTASRHLLEKLGFRNADQRYNGSEPPHCRYVRYC